MKTKYQFFFLGILLLLQSCDKESMTNPPDEQEELNPSESYFPPPAHSEWDTISTSDLDWDLDKQEQLLAFLDEQNTKGFIILKDGKIALERYFNDHTLNKNWNWFSAAKSLTSAMVGVANMEGEIDLEVASSEYLGPNWSSLSKEDQDKIKVFHHLSMSTGLQNPIDEPLEWICTLPLCFQYEAEAGSRWAYHQGAFILVQDMITKATNTNYKGYCRQKIQDKIGMNGTWAELAGLRIFSSTTRSMARFGMLALNKGKWGSEIIYPEAYHNDMIESSQEMNKAYGMLWWLNGKSDYMGTKDQTIYSGSLIPNAPEDMFCALGAQDQKIYVVPSQDLVVVRCGDAAGSSEFAQSSFDNLLWGYLKEMLP